MRVLITFEQDASAEIAQSTFGSIWAIDSPVNRSAAEIRWSQESYRGFEVTVFRPQSVGHLVWTVFEHHPDCETLEIRQAEEEAGVWEELAIHHFVPLKQSRGVLRAGRRNDV